jgi:predicted protein tyrosine phosphatase
MYKFKIKRNLQLALNSPKIIWALFKATFPSSRVKKPITIKVMNRWSIETYYETEPHIVISIGDPFDKTLVIMPPSYSRKCVLRLKFHDWDDRQKIVLEESSNPEAKNMVYYSEEQAKQVFDFVYEFLPRIEMIICQCEAGISRSAGMAAALSKALTGEDEYYFKHYIPNSRVYRLTLNKWMEEIIKK